MTYLGDLIVAAKNVQEQAPDFQTAEFTVLCDQILQAFEYLGSVMHFAKSEMAVKNESLKKAAPKFATLKEVVAHDVAAGTATVKDTCTRNLHRLMTVVKFLRIMFEQLLSSEKISVKEAASTAYDASLGPIHTSIVRTTVKAGLFALPSRASFLKSIGETEESAKGHATEFIELANKVYAQLEVLFKDINMPASTVTMSWWGSSK